MKFSIFNIVLAAGLLGTALAAPAQAEVGVVEKRQSVDSAAATVDQLYAKIVTLTASISKTSPDAVGIIGFDSL